ncbi:PRC-barrel domain-containing protein [Pedobacter sp.]|uniref:PRC-barrel domain-containing protein n=1 Tax=Pedobacter sp. TaxID=1411316 RepID=UPI003D7FD335
MEQNTYRYLQELSNSDFQIVDGEPDITGWDVKNEAGAYIGKVEELLFDPQTRAVRYLVVDLNDNLLNLGDKKIMIPLGIAHLHTSDDEVVLPGLHVDQFNALPPYDKAALGPEMEVQIRNVIGSPAALRIEETIAEFDQDTFYKHHHFDKGRFYKRGGQLGNPVSRNPEAEDLTNSRF